MRTRHSPSCHWCLLLTFPILTSHYWHSSGSEDLLGLHYLILQLILRCFEQVGENVSNWPGSQQEKKSTPISPECPSRFLRGVSINEYQIKQSTSGRTFVATLRQACVSLVQEPTPPSRGSYLPDQQGRNSFRCSCNTSSIKVVFTASSRYLDIPTYEPFMKIRTTKNETVGTDLLEMMLDKVTDSHPYPRCWWDDPFS